MLVIGSSPCRHLSRCLQMLSLTSHKDFICMARLQK